jgi:acyl-CoA thioester hydrolase
MSEPLEAPFDVVLRVRYEETDRMGVVYHGKYFEYFEVGRTEWLRARGFAYRDMEARGAGLVVAEARARYLAPAHYDDLLTIRTRLVELGRATVDFRYEVLRGDALLALGETQLVSVGPGGRPRRLPEELARLGAAARGDEGGDRAAAR